MTETTNSLERKLDGGLAGWIDICEAMSEGNPEDTELLMLLIELRCRRSNVELTAQGEQQ